MKEFTKKQQEIIGILLEEGGLSSSEIHLKLNRPNETVSLVTVKRALSKMAAAGYVAVSGAGRSTNYHLSILGRVLSPVDAHKYCFVEPDKRRGLRSYNFDLFSLFPVKVFLSKELEVLSDSTSVYNLQTKDLSEVVKKKELERLIIELSWKSSKIEGNTYTLLDTEKLILENKAAEGKTTKETQMILNHKDAFNFVHDNKKRFEKLDLGDVEKLHSILVKDMGVSFGLRSKSVGVTGSVYRPLDNIHQVREAIISLIKLIERVDDPYTKALVAILGIGYIQPFEDGNKRTGRLLANAILLAHDLAPLSYRSVDENEYREAMLVFYELNSLSSFKKIFVEQYRFAALNYAVK